MKLDLFSKNDSVLLLGEGNFSFSVCLLKHELPINITATCFEKEISHELQKQNIEYLISRNVPVFINVDATKLHENPNFRDKQFDKIIFNFPHVGGKMKIQLNRELLKETFKSATQLITNSGFVIVSLCRGQGGTPFDQPQRRWDDSWQIVEMSAHGDFILTEVQPFKRENFTEYTCMGYRSQDVKFNLEGALVHVFVKSKPPFEVVNEGVAEKRLGFVPLKRSTVSAPVTYSQLYNSEPLSNSYSGISFFRDLIVNHFNEVLVDAKLEILTDDEIPVFVTTEEGVACIVNTNGNRAERCLRSNALQILETAIEICNIQSTKNQIVFHPGMYFNRNSGKNFTRTTPITYQFLILGESISDCIQNLIRKVLGLFQKNNVTCESRSHELVNGAVYGNNRLIKSAIELVCRDTEKGFSFVPAVVYTVENKGKKRLEACVMNIEGICEFFFRLKTPKELWADGNKVVCDENGIPVLKQTLLYPSEYKFDITLKYKTDEIFPEDKMYEILWLAAGQLIEQVQRVNEFASQEDWSSKCFRITYKSLDKPLYRNRVIDIHSKIVAPMLAQGLNVSIG